jgi:hypothetical protein
MKYITSKINHSIFISDMNRNIGVIYVFLINLSLIILSFGLLTKVNLSPDTLSLVGDISSQAHLDNGRAISYFLSCLLEDMKIDVINHQCWFIIFFIICICSAPL